MADHQPALATTKRKFHKLLDNLTAASTSTTSLASTLQESNASTPSLTLPPSPEPPSKRPRSANASTASLDRQRNISAGQERIRALKEQLLTPRRERTIKVVGNTQAQPPSDATPRKAPNFLPYSQEQFLGRLKTFADVKKWTSKPDGIREVEWAKRGWSCESWNTVACMGGCEKHVAVKLRPKRRDGEGKEIDMTEDMSSPFDSGLVARYEDLLVNGHQADCLWRKRGCQEDIHHIPIASRAKTSSDLLARYHAMESLTPDLPLLTNLTHPGPPIPTILQRLPPTFFTTNSPPSHAPPSPAALAFALFGWTGVRESRISLAVCTHCFQRLGLWLSSDARLREMSAKLAVPMASLRLDLLESHREHCPWKNAVVQANPLDGPIAHMAAWQTLQFVLLGKRREVEGVQEREGRHERVESGDAGVEEYPRGSLDSGGRSLEMGGVDGEGEGDGEDEGEGSLQDKWRKFKAKLRRTTSKKSLKDAKSIKSVKSAKSGKSIVVKKGRDKDKDKENNKA
ncbi:zf-C3HC-domain-containing protein [Dothidotthia symphoricarpi CBS 119687]|uniref:Zf-C3HC-domain-containing protein n=1 Tax=Dothidotthia symphoricarpi CBS 119687 TaxID=1392245 RepID=A0A6A6AG80_9PLEO|nr:zf-C3HC-domain-containing protein [Dothidotthia symphoricarpi CBS 119687]KAF2130576.1 zf-C3HC-domain-containing protein [Dothidotthia symphoricarpi CBS 119687]